MNNIYFEMSDVGEQVFGHRYFVKYPSKHLPMSGASMLHIKIMASANRVWQQTNDNVKFIKHRYIVDYENEPVDMEEFFLIMMAATPIE